MSRGSDVGMVVVVFTALPEVTVAEPVHKTTFEAAQSSVNESGVTAVMTPVLVLRSASGRL